MIVWQMADKLDVIVQEILCCIPKREFKLRSQINNASDSVGSNFVEGYYSGSLAEYIRFNRYGKRSLAELLERVRRTLRKGYILPILFERFEDCAIKTMYLFDRLIRSLENKLSKEKEESKQKKVEKGRRRLFKEAI